MAGRWDSGIRTYPNYGRATPSRNQILKDLMGLHLKVARFAALRAESPEDKVFAAIVADGLDGMLQRVLALDEAAREAREAKRGTE